MESSVKPLSYLKKISGADVGKIYPLFSTFCSIGRASNNTVCLVEPFLSRRHCSIRYEDTVWIITDYGGVNGTYINGQKIESSGYTILNDKAIVFLGDPEESTCGFIFLTSLPVSAQQAYLAGEGSSSNVVPASVPGPLPLNPGLPSSSSPMELADSTDPPPDQSDDISSTRSVPDLDAARERPCRSLAWPDKNRERVKQKMSKLRLMMMQRRCNLPSESALNDRMLPILYDASTKSPRSTLRSSIGPYIHYPQRIPSYSLYSPPSTSPEREIMPEEVPNQTGSEVNDLQQSRGSSSLSVPRTFPSEAGSSRGTPSNPPEFDVLDMLVDSINSDGSDSDCSFASMDSLRTRIRKQRGRVNRAQSDGSLNSSPTKAVSSSAPRDDVELLGSSIDRLVKSLTEQDSQTLQDSESLICDIEDGVKDCVNKLEDKDWMNGSKSEDSDAVQYLKDRVLKLQKNVMDVTEELKSALEKNKEQQSIIQELQSTQGVTRETLSEDLETELSCNICTEVLIKPVILDCGHIFCQYCIGVWKKKKKQCPNCREAIRTENEVKILDSYISRVIDHLEPMYRMKRNELIESRKSDTVKVKKSSRKRTPTYRVAAALGPVNPDVFPELRVYRSTQSATSTRRSLTLRLRNLHQRNDNTLLRRLVSRIENRALNQEAH